MNNKDRIAGAAATSILGALFSYLLIVSLIKNSCSFSILNGQNLSADSTALFVSVAIGSCLFAFCYVLIGGEAAGKFEKLVALGLALVAILWLADLVANGNVCSPVAWRRHVTLLIVPSLLATLAIIGRNWLNSNDE